MAGFQRIPNYDSRLLFAESSDDSGPDERSRVGVFRAFSGAKARSSSTQSSQSAGRDILDDADWRAVARSARGIWRLELHLATIPSLGRKRCLGRDPGGPRREPNLRNDIANDRCDDCPGTPLRSWRKRGTRRNALGRSRGGFSSKINARTNKDGLPIAIVITPGQAHDVTAYPALMQEVDRNPEQLLADKAYDTNHIRRDIKDRGGQPMIPTKASRKLQAIIEKAVYGLRNRIERFFNRVKNSRRVATRYDKLIETFAAFVLLATIRIWFRFVHTT